MIIAGIFGGNHCWRGTHLRAHECKRHVNEKVLWQNFRTDAFFPLSAIDMILSDVYEISSNWGTFLGVLVDIIDYGPHWHCSSVLPVQILADTRVDDIILQERDTAAFSENVNTDTQSIIYAPPVRFVDEERSRVDPELETSNYHRVFI